MILAMIVRPPQVIAKRNSTGTTGAKSVIDILTQMHATVATLNDALAEQFDQHRLALCCAQLLGSDRSFREDPR
jgi:hypothetical protein